MDNPKSPISYDEQLQKLKDKGFVISNEQLCRTALSEIGYYRLKGYLLPFRKTDNKTGKKSYQSGIDLNRVCRIYEFDCKLRNLLLFILERIEIYLRAKIVHCHVCAHGSDGYRNEEYFSDEHDHEKFLNRLKYEMIHNKNHLIVKYYNKNYGGILPLWAISEFFTFGMLSRFYADMLLKDKEKIASELYHTIPKNLKSWLQCATDIRNICAHGGRLYYRLFTSVPAGLNLSKSQETRLWGAIKTLRVLYPDKEEWNIKILPQLDKLFCDYKDDIDLYHIAFPRDWRKRLKNENITEYI